MYFKQGKKKMKVIAMDFEGTFLRGILKGEPKVGN